MKPFATHIFSVAAILGVLIVQANVRSAVLYELPLALRQETIRFNANSYAGFPIALLTDAEGNPVKPSGSDGRQPTIESQQTDGLTLNTVTPGNFRGALFFGSGVVPSDPSALDSAKSLAENSALINLPRFPADSAPQIILSRAQVGGAYLGRTVSFLFGSVIPVPGVDANQATLPQGESVRYWLPEPHSTNQHSGAPYYWSPHARQVFAVQSGPIRISWRKAKPSSTKPADFDDDPSRYFLDGGSYYSILSQEYYVASASVKPARTMYWTESTFRATG